MTTIIYKAGKIFADSRITQVALIDGGWVEESHADTEIKIYEPSHLNVAGKPILAVAVAGQSRMMEVLKNLNDLGEKNNRIFHMDDADVPQAIQNAIPFKTSIMMVTTASVFVIEATKEEYKLTKFSLAHYVAMGSGIDHAPHIIETIKKVSPEVAMSDAMLADKGTGGEVSVWQYGRKGIKRFMPKAHYSKFDRYMASWLHSFALIGDVARLALSLAKYQQEFKTN